jgi:hypothetical protein
MISFLEEMYSSMCMKRNLQMPIKTTSSRTLQSNDRLQRVLLPILHQSNFSTNHQANGDRRSGFVDGGSMGDVS